MTLAQAKKLRSQMTDAEWRLWYFLRAHRFRRLKFRRQVPIGRYIVDFMCFDFPLVIELDGGQHADSVKDQIRDDWLRKEGYYVLRFWNNDVLKRTDAVLSRIMEATESLPKRHPSPGSLRSPPSPSRGEGT